MSPHKFKDYSMVKINIDVHVANATVYSMEVLPPKGQPFLKGNTSLWMSYLSLGREDDCQIASFDSSLPQIVYMDYKRNHKDKLNGIWQSWNGAKKTCFWDKYGNVA
ncbi:hypothetical protein Goshw_012499 [Gossypium schwendimanii]|uniref:Uncharacterized protein n=1 Tax=Gossypium schwendimanii TaxID=34291 RepID=A0A7J9L2V0_GOSSC|nr:hypothetical protein [Gossypium schwendimanii]